MTTSENDMLMVEVAETVGICTFCFFPQQRKLMGSSAQNSSGVHWCRHRVRFNEVPEKVLKVLKVPEKVCEALVQSQVRFKGFGEGSEEDLGGFGAEPGQVQQVPEKVLGSLDAKPSQVQQGSREGSGEGSRKP